MSARCRRRFPSRDTSIVSVRDTRSPASSRPGRRNWCFWTSERRACRTSPAPWCCRSKPSHPPPPSFRFARNRVRACSSSRKLWDWFRRCRRHSPTRISKRRRLTPLAPPWTRSEGFWPFSRRRARLRRHHRRTQRCLAGGAEPQLPHAVHRSGRGDGRRVNPIG